MPVAVRVAAACGEEEAVVVVSVAVELLLFRCEYDEVEEEGRVEVVASRLLVLG